MRSNRRSRTAQYAVLVRALLTDKRIVDDPLAVGMLTPTMRVGYEVLRRTPRMTRSAFYGAMATRTLFFDRALVSALDAGIDQVVVVGAGYDSRAWRMARPGVRYVEVDHPATQADKTRRAPAGGPAYVACDLAHQKVSRAVDGTIDPSRPVAIVIEGVTMYLETEDLHALLVDLASFAATGSKLIINFAAPSARTTRHNRTSSRILSVAGRVQGERFLSARDIDDPAGVIAASGWRVDRAVSLHELAPVLVGPASGLDLANVSDYARTVVAIHADS